MSIGQLLTLLLVAALGIAAGFLIARKSFALVLEQISRERNSQASREKALKKREEYNRKVQETRKRELEKLQKEIATLLKIWTERYPDMTVEERKEKAEEVKAKVRSNFGVEMSEFINAIYGLSSGIYFTDGGGFTDNNPRGTP